MKFRVDRASDWGVHTEPEAPVPSPPTPPIAGATFEGWTVYRIPRGDPHRNPHSSYTPIWTIEVDDLAALLNVGVAEGTALIVSLPPTEEDRRGGEWEVSPLEHELPLITIYDSYVE